MDDFSKDVIQGLSSYPKYLSSKYFYDKKGSEIFQKIMRMPEYYLTDSELEIFENHKQEILFDFTGDEDKFDLIELGAGDGLKSKILLAHFISQNTNFSYSTIDISGEAVHTLISDLKFQFPTLNTYGLIGDYFDHIEGLKSNGSTKKIILFLGSNIGNFTNIESIEFLSSLGKIMNPNDQVLIGFDLKKSPDIILNAYDDPHGHTSDFNLNLLDRINNTLGGNFILNNFIHKEIYSEETGTASSYLISLKEQSVSLSDLNHTFNFKEGERIFMEISQKYDDEMINSIAEKSGFEIVRNYSDTRLYFTNSLWKLKL